MFELSKEEFENLRSQIVITSNHGGRRHLPFAFTEQGVAMLSGVLKSKKAVQTNIVIMRAFVAVRQFALNYAELSQKIIEIEKHLNGDDENLKDIFQPFIFYSKKIRKLKTKKTERKSGLKSKSKHQDLTKSKLPPFVKTTIFAKIWKQKPFMMF